jgi:4'-phosphopantetheinyl transferase
MATTYRTGSLAASAWAAGSAEKHDGRDMLHHLSMFPHSKCESSDVSRTFTGRVVLCSDDVVHIWFANLDVNEEESRILWHTLSEEERLRAAAHAIPKIRRRFVAARAFFRQVLGYQLGISSSQLPLKYGPRGKPVVEEGYQLQFNMSHSEDLAAMALTRVRQVGIDVEVIRKNIDFSEIADRFFCAAEAARIERYSGHCKALMFYKHWTCKEAYLKARGAGLSEALDSFEVDVDLSQIQPTLNVQRQIGQTDWSVRVVRCDQTMVAAVAVEGSDNWETVTKTWSLSGI